MANATIFGLGNANHGPDDPIKASKIYNPRNFFASQTGEVANGTYYFGPMRTDGSWQKLHAAVTEVIATGADRTATIDLLKSTGGGAFATVLSVTIVLDDDSTLRVVEAASFSDADFVAGDLFKLSVTVAGSADDQAEGVVIGLYGAEEPA